MAQKTIVIWGAGKIGRGFVADLFHTAGYRIVFVDASGTLVAQLSQAGRYTIVRAESPDKRQDGLIEGYSALSTAQTFEVAAAVAATDLLALAVFPQDFAQVAQQLVDGILYRQVKHPGRPLDIILCTNLAHAGPQFRDLLQEALPLEAREYFDAQVGIVETLVIRMVAEPPAELRQREPLLVWTNGHPQLILDQRGFKGEIPRVPGLCLVDDMRAEEIRKLYTYNTFQAALAYLGALRGHKLAVECLADPQVRAGAEAALDEASRALQAAYGFAAGEMASWKDNVVTQTNNPILGDTVRRLGADPRRKLRREDRLSGPALLARKHGIEPKHLIRAIAAGLCYDDLDDPGVVHVQQRLAVLGLPEGVREVCGLTAAETDLAEAIVRAYQRLAAKEK